MEIAPRVSPLLLLLRDAAAAAIQPDLRELLSELDDARHSRMSENAQFMHDAGHLGDGVTTQAAADLMWSVTSPEMYALFVVRRVWSLEEYAEHIFHTVSSLLASHTTHRLLIAVAGNARQTALRGRIEAIANLPSVGQPSGPPDRPTSTPIAGQRPAL